MVARAKSAAVSAIEPSAARPALLTVPEAANRLAISPRKLWEMLAGGVIPAVRIGKAVRIDPIDLANWIEAAKTKL